MHFLRGSGAAGLRGMLPRALLDESWDPPSTNEITNTRMPSRQIREFVAYSWTAQSPAVSSTDGDMSEPPPSSAPGAPVSPRLHLVRPLLSISRADIETYCAEYRLAPRTDRSNEDTTFFRNRLRHELLPFLETYNPGIRDVLAHTADVLAGDHAVLSRAVEAAWTSLVSVEGPDEVRFSLPVWRGLPLWPGSAPRSARRSTGCDAAYATSTGSMSSGRYGWRVRDIPGRPRPSPRDLRFRSATTRYGAWPVRARPGRWICLK